MPATELFAPPGSASVAHTPGSPGDSDTLYEVVNGQRVECPPMGARASYLSSSLTGLLWPFARTQRLGTW